MSTPLPHQRIPLGMVGGGAGAFIGGVHRIAARMDDRFTLVAGALSSNPATAATSAAQLGLARSYDDYHEMAKAEAAHPDGIRAVSIVTPNHLHAGPAIAFLEAGIHVICDKPLAATAEEATALAAVVAKAKARFFLTHNYAALPLIREARAMVAEGALGDLRLIQVNYLQGWLSDHVDSKQAGWRTDPKKAGAGALGDIGTHAWQLAQFVTGQTPAELAADVSAIVPGRQIDDDARMMLRYGSGLKGGIWVSQAAVGHENGLTLDLYGSEGALHWAQETPERLIHVPKGQPPRILTRAQDRSGSFRTPPGHPEGYLEGFANLYSDIADIIQGGTTHLDRVPGIEAGLSGMRFIAAAQDSSAANGKWTRL